MSGYAKRIYEKFILESKNSFSKYIKSIVEILPQKITEDSIITLIKEFYPYEYQVFCERCNSFSKHEKALKKIKQKSRYGYINSNTFILGLPVSQNLLRQEYQKNHKKSYDKEKAILYAKCLHETRDPYITRIRKKVEKAKLKTQQMEPVFLDKLIGLYDRRNTTQKDRIYIMIELEKYYNSKIVHFFQRKMNSEFNFQLRQRAFLYLQNMGHYAILRSQKSMPLNTKSKEKRQQLREYAKQTFDIAAIPQELEYRIENNALEQRLKHFDYFISHSSIDFQLVQNIIVMLNAHNKNIYCDWINDNDYLKRHLVGEATLEVIKKRIKMSDAILFVKTENSINSVWVKYELNYAHQLGKKIFELDEFSNLKSIHILNDKWFLDVEYANLILFHQGG